MLGELDSDVQKYMKVLTKAGTPASAPVVLAFAEGVMMARSRSLLPGNGVRIKLNCPWAASTLCKFFLERIGSTPMIASLSDQQILHVKFTHLSQISKIPNMHKIPPKLIVNWDQAGVNLVPPHNPTMEQGSSRFEIASINDKKQITVTLAGSLSRELLPIQLLYQGKQLLSPKIHISS